MFKPGYEWRTLVCSDIDDYGYIIYKKDSIEQISDGKRYYDELVIDDWFHLEKMDDSRYWMRVGEYRINVKFDDSNKPVVNIEEEYSG